MLLTDGCSMPEESRPVTLAENHATSPSHGRQGVG